MLSTEEATCGEGKFILFKVYLGESVRMSTGSESSHRVKPYWGNNDVNSVKGFDKISRVIN